MGPDLEELLALLRERAARQSLYAQAEGRCRQWFLNTPEEMPYPLAAIRFEEQTQMLCFNNVLLSYPYITTRLRLFIGEHEVGDYRLITLLDGTAVDDYLTFDPQLTSWLPATLV